MGIKKAYYRHYFILYLYYLIYCFDFLCFLQTVSIQLILLYPVLFLNIVSNSKLSAICLSVFRWHLTIPPLEISIELFRHLRLSHFIIHYTVTSFSILIISFCCFIHCLFISLIISFSFFFLSSFFYVNLISLRNKR